MRLRGERCRRGARPDARQGQLLHPSRWHPLSPLSLHRPATPGPDRAIASNSPVKSVQADEVEDGREEGKHEAPGVDGDLHSCESPVAARLLVVTVFAGSWWVWPVLGSACRARSYRRKHRSRKKVT